jgi:hypothetical protein
MSQKFNKGDAVFVPSSRFKELKEYGSALYLTEISETNKKSIKIKLPDGKISNYIGSSLAHTNTGIIIITIGDIETESTLLEPLRKSVLQFSRLLLPDDYILTLFCRSIEEFDKLWQKNNCAYSYLVLIGHGDKKGFKFGVNGLVRAEEFIKIIEKSSCNAKHIISLCCNTGYEKVGSIISKSSKCIDYIAPFQSIHGAEASQFAQTFLISHLLKGQSTKVAFTNSNNLFASKSNFRLWIKGKFK